MARRPRVTVNSSRASWHARASHHAAHAGTVSLAQFIVRQLAVAAHGRDRGRRWVLRIWRRRARGRTSRSRWCSSSAAHRGIHIAARMATMPVHSRACRRLAAAALASSDLDAPEPCGVRPGLQHGEHVARQAVLPWTGRTVAPVASASEATLPLIVINNGHVVAVMLPDTFTIECEWRLPSWMFPFVTVGRPPQPQYEVALDELDRLLGKITLKESTQGAFNDHIKEHFPNMPDILVERIILVIAICRANASGLPFLMEFVAQCNETVPFTLSWRNFNPDPLGLVLKHRAGNCIFGHMAIIQLLSLHEETSIKDA